MKDEEYFSQLVSETFRSLSFYLKYLGIPDSDIEDIAQEVYLKAFVAFSRFDPNLPFKSWLFAIARNRCIDHHRRLKKQRKNCEKNFVKDYCETFEENSDKRHAIKNLMGRLSPKEQLFIELRFFQELPFKEIAEITGFTEASIKMRVMRLLNLLKNRLTRE